MSNSAIDDWFGDGRPALIGAKSYRPLEHPSQKGTPLVSQRGQADSVFVQADDGTQWVLKIFKPNQRPGTSYLRAISSLLPREKGFRSGTDRIVLGRTSLTRRRGCFFSDALARVLEGAVIMLRAPGMSWTTLSARVRAAEYDLDDESRWRISRNLSGMVEQLESHGCSHRDFSSGNLFLDLADQCPWPIDYDGLYHRQLEIPQGIKAGSDGYLPAFMYFNGAAQPELSWRQAADRFALAILIVEILTMTPGATEGEDGGLFTQEELCAGDGKGIRFAQGQVKRFHASVAALFRRALAATSFDMCPSPGEWVSALDAHRTARSTSIRSIEPIQADYFQNILTRRRSKVPLPPPKLVTLPPDPWKGSSGRGAAGLHHKFVRY